MPKPTKGKRLGGSSSHEDQIISNLISALIEHEKIETTVTKAKSTRAHSSGMPMYMTTCVYHGRNKNVSDPQNKPFAVLDVIAADNALVASPFLAIGNPSTIVAAAELAPGMPSSTPLNESPVVDEATTATQKITPKYGSPTK